MNSSTLFETPDEFSKHLLEVALNTSTILLVPKTISRKRLASFYRSNAKRLRHFRGEEELQKESYRLRDLSGSTVFQRVRYAIGKIFGGIAIGPAEYPMEITFASNQSKFAVRDDSVGEIVRIDENELSASTLAKFLDAYAPLPMEQRPLILIETHEPETDIDNRLRKVPDEFEFLRLGDHGALEKVIVSRLPCTSVSDLVDHYAENSFSPIARMTMDELGSAIPADTELANRFATKLFHLRSVATECGKFETLDLARALLVELERRSTSELSGDLAPVLLATKLFTNLWLLYCEEGPKELLDNSMAIAAHFGDELMQAHCLRMINIVKPHDSFTNHCSHRAAKIFFQHGAFDYANYCINNALVGKFYTDESSASDFSDVINGSAEVIAGFRGLAIMMSNAGVAHMIDGDHQSAITWFERAKRHASWPLHRFGIEVNLLIAKFLEGDDPDGDALVKLARAITRQIDKRYKYQIANLLLNIRLLAQRQREAAEELTRILAETRLLEDGVVLKDHTTLRALAAHLKLVEGYHGERTGLRGKFIERYAFVPIFHHTWL